MKECTGCWETLASEMFPLNSTRPDGLHGHCFLCHRKASSKAYRARLAKEAARRAERAEGALWQRWRATCVLCAKEREFRRRATGRPLSLIPEQMPCPCGSSCLMELITGPVTLGAAAAELRRIGV